jgi:hypothetical protein
MASSKKAGETKKPAGSKQPTGSKKANGSKQAADAAKKATGAKRATAAKKTASVKAAPASISFARQIVPLFRTIDVQCMRSRGVFLINYDYMKDPDNANMVLDMVSPDGEPRMPYGGPYWTDASIKLFQDWINGGLQP